MKSKSKGVIIHSSPEIVFDYMDNLSNTGMHMMENSGMMMGSKLQLEQLSDHAKGLNAKFRWSGKMMGITMDFTTVVTEWVFGKEKTWETIGNSKMIILKWYKMRLSLEPRLNGHATEAKLNIDYTLPDNIFLKILGIILSPWYANWCLNNMLRDTKANLEGLPKSNIA